MKIFKIILLAVVTTCLTFSCSNDDDNGGDSDSIIGTWKWTSSSVNGVNDPLTECHLLNTFTFTSTAYSAVEHKSGSAPCTANDYNGTYTISGIILTWDVNSNDPDVDEIQTLNSTSLVLKKEENDGNSTFVYLDTYTRQ